MLSTQNNQNLCQLCIQRTEAFYCHQNHKYVKNLSGVKDEFYVLFVFHTIEINNTAYSEEFLYFQTVEIINTAMITGKVQNFSLQIFAISQKSQISDITHEATCHSGDDRVLKVRKLTRGNHVIVF